MAMNVQIESSKIALGWMETQYRIRFRGPANKLYQT